ncbi:hypothetical protein [Chryseobacterium sp.]|uniref:hypothetical protein n=1 Tax=Chryseobacterium sp. TaxID=1871047 RepID=UPI000EC9979D|nr:hypothetical protein [Chryseobacterium sp.]HCA05693.1 hypothetical protein [Chryseobacterium sp.]
MINKLLLIFSLSFISCSAQNIRTIQKSSIEELLNVSLELYKSQNSVDSSKDIFLILSSKKINDTIGFKDATYGIGITIIEKRNAKNIIYKKLYKYKSYLVVSEDSLDVFKPLIIQIPYQNINNQKIPDGIIYDPFNISFMFNEKSEIIYLYPTSKLSFFKKRLKNTEIIEDK